MTDYDRGWRDAMKAAAEEFTAWYKDSGRTGHYMVNGKGVVTLLEKAAKLPGTDLSTLD